MTGEGILDAIGSDHYGICLCSRRYESRQVPVEVATADDLVALGDVPQGACPQCGAKVYKAALLCEIEALYGAAPPSP